MLFESFCARHRSECRIGTCYTFCRNIAFTSCGDTEMCYKITVKTKILGIENSTTYYERATKNNIKDREDELKAALEATGVSEDAITISSVAAPDSNCE